MQSKKATSKEEGDAVAKAFEQMYKQSHPNGPYPPVELKPKLESQSPKGQKKLVKIQLTAVAAG